MVPFSGVSPLAEPSKNEILLAQVLAEYRYLTEKGESVDQERFIADHADVADDLRSLFAASEQVGGGQLDAIPEDEEELRKPRTTRGRMIVGWLVFLFLFSSDIRFWAIIIVSIALHELGHYWVAKSRGVHVLKFRVSGFGTLLKGTHQETQFSLGIVPLYGYCLFNGVSVDEEENEKTAKEHLKKRPELGELVLDRSGWFSTKSPKERIAILAGGVLLNLGLAAFLMLVLTLSIGQRELVQHMHVTGVGPGSLAEQFGVRVGDEVLAVDGVPVYSWMQVRKQISADRGHGTVLTLKRGDEFHSIGIDEKIENSLLENAAPNQIEALGLSLSRSEIQLTRVSPQAAPRVTAERLFRLSRDGILSLPTILAGKTSLTGFGGIDRPLEDISRQGIFSVATLEDTLILAICLNLAIALFNLLPIPPLDGGRLLFPILELFGIKAGKRVRSIVITLGSLIVLTYFVHGIFFL